LFSNGFDWVGNPGRYESARYSFVNVLSLGPPTCAFHATDLAEAHCSGDFGSLGSGGFSCSNVLDQLTKTAEGESTWHCDSMLSHEFDGKRNSGKCQSLWDLVNLSDLVHSREFEMSDLVVSHDCDGMIHSGELTILTFLFGSSLAYFREPDAGRADQTQSLTIVSTIIGIVVAVSLLIVGGVILLKANHSRTLSTRKSEVGSEVDLPDDNLSSLTGFETFLSEENGLTDGDAFCPQNAVNDSDVDETFV
jgi:hypothetical protein